MAIQEAAQKEQRKKTLYKVILGVIIVAIVCGLAACAYAANLFHIKRLLGIEIDPSTDYSAQLTDEGKIADVSTADYVGTFDPSTVTVSEGLVTYTDDDLASYIEGVVENYKELKTEITREAASGDTLSINYVGTVAGEEFDGGSADEQDLTLGSGSFIDDFEDQLIGAHPGDDVTVNVTFPDDYGVDDLNGKDAVFAVHVNGIYETPAFNDEFVQTNLSDSGYTTADEYKEAYRADQVKDLYASAIDSWIGENVTLDRYPEAYLKHCKALQITNDQNSFEQYKSLYESFGMTFDYDDYEDFFSTDDRSYEEVRDENAETAVTKAIVYQNVFENAGLTITDEDYQTFLDENSYDDTDVETYGKPYLMQQFIKQKAQEYMQDLVTVTADTEDTADEASTEAAAE